MYITKEDIRRFLEKVKEAVNTDNYRIQHGSKRQDNNALFLDYVIDEDMAKTILLSLTPEDFSEVLQNEHTGYEHELLYVFGKDVSLLKRFGCADEIVSLYIKLNKLNDCFVIVVSFHKQRYPIKYMFK